MLLAIIVPVIFVQISYGAYSGNSSVESSPVWVNEWDLCLEILMSSASAAGKVWLTFRQDARFYSIRHMLSWNSV